MGTERFEFIFGRFFRWILQISQSREFFTGRLPEKPTPPSLSQKMKSRLPLVIQNPAFSKKAPPPHPIGVPFLWHHQASIEKGFHWQ